MTDRKKGSEIVNKAVKTLNNPYLVAVVTGLFVFGFVRRFVGR